ncbi:MAG: hypothetical protein LRS46_03435 [Desulfurococcales archaeon]|nr:hypothetical protein [Desulfurococcales archaeon]
MLRRGVGLVTGMHDVSIDSAVVVDSLNVYDNIKRTSNGGIVEYTGSSGFRVITGGKILGRTAVALVPPYPPAVYEAVQELIVYGARRVVAVVRGYSLRRNVPPDSIVLANAAIAADSVTQYIVPKEMPLLATRSLYTQLSEEIIRKGQGGFAGYYRGKIVLTVDSARAILEHTRERVDRYSHYKDVVALDTVTAPLYALQYIYPSLEVSSLIYIVGDADYALRIIEEDIDLFHTKLHRASRLLSMLALSVTEILVGGGVGVEAVGR